MGEWGWRGDICFCFKNKHLVRQFSSRNGKMKRKVERESEEQPKAASTHYRSIVRFLFVQASARIVEYSTDFKPGF